MCYQKYECALQLLEVAAQEASLHQLNVMIKVAALIDWEIVFVKSHYLHADWHNRARGKCANVYIHYECLQNLVVLKICTSQNS